MSRYHWNPRHHGPRPELPLPSLESDIRYFRKTTRRHRQYIITEVSLIAMLEQRGKDTSRERSHLEKLCRDHAEHLAAFRRAVKRLRERREGHVA